jgi:DNA-binding XRE family transcriptional regulator
MGPDSLRNLAKCAAQDVVQYAATRTRIRFRRLRMELGLSQEQLAPLLKCHRNTVAQYEHPRGTAIPAAALDALEALAFAAHERRAVGE